LNPLLLMAAYFFVFAIVLQARFPGDTSRSGFVLYFLAGMLPWLAISEAVGRAPSVLLEHRNFVMKLVFPLETLPVNVTLAGLVTQAFALAIFLVLLLVTRGTIPPSILWLPAILVTQVLLTLGLCWLLSAAGVFVRDLGQVMGFVLTLWFFLTPICYPESALPSEALRVLGLNPVLVLVRAYRATMLENRAPDWLSLGIVFVFAAALAVAGHAWFYRLRKSFADVI
jgi:lipopolysaccharide transport system permease protein